MSNQQGDAFRQWPLSSEGSSGRSEFDRRVTVFPAPGEITVAQGLPPIMLTHEPARRPALGAPWVAAPSLSRPIGSPTRIPRTDRSRSVAMPMLKISLAGGIPQTTTLASTSPAGWEPDRQYDVPPVATPAVSPAASIAASVPAPLAVSEWEPTPSPVRELSTFEASTVSPWSPSAPQTAVIDEAPAPYSPPPPMPELPATTQAASHESADTFETTSRYESADSFLPPAPTETARSAETAEPSADLSGSPSIPAPPPFAVGANQANVPRRRVPSFQTGKVRQRAASLADTPEATSTPQAEIPSAEIPHAGIPEVEVPKAGIRKAEIDATEVVPAPVGRGRVESAPAVAAVRAGRGSSASRVVIATTATRSVPLPPDVVAAATARAAASAREAPAAPTATLKSEVPSRRTRAAAVPAGATRREPTPAGGVHVVSRRSGLRDDVKRETTPSYADPRPPEAPRQTSATRYVPPSPPGDDSYPRLYASSGPRRGRRAGVLMLAASVAGVGSFAAVQALGDSPADGQGDATFQLGKSPTSSDAGAATTPGTSRGGTRTGAVGQLTPVLVPGADSLNNGRVVTYSLQIEEGLGADSVTIARKVGKVLRDRRGWQTETNVRFVQVSPTKLRQGARVELRIIVASPATVDKLCAPVDTGGDLSCGREGMAVLNYKRWVGGADAYKDDVDQYRTYLINHEVGHNIGQAHVQCPAAGQPAPVMVQQTLGLQGCTAWPWPVLPND